MISFPPSLQNFVQYDVCPICPEKEGYKLDLLEHNNVSPPTSTLIKDRLRRLTALQIMSSILFVISILLKLHTKK